MKKIVKKIISLSMCICMMMALTVGASAAGPATTWGSPANAVHWRNNGYTNAYMNAFVYTPADVADGTRVTCYAKNNDNTQRFYTQTGYLKNASRTDLVVKQVTIPTDMEPIVVLSSNTSSATYTFESYEDGYKIIDRWGQVLTFSGIVGTSDTVAFSDDIGQNYDAVWSLE